MPYKFPINKHPELFQDNRATVGDPDSHYISYRMVILYGIARELKQASVSDRSSIPGVIDKIEIDLTNMKEYLEAIDNPNNLFTLKRCYRGMLFDLHEIEPGILLNDHNECSYPLILHRSDIGPHRLSAFLHSLSDVHKNFTGYVEIMHRYLETNSLSRSDEYDPDLLKELNNKISELSTKKTPTRPGV
jgi:hypothetical protein